MALPRERTQDTGDEFSISASFDTTVFVIELFGELDLSVCGVDGYMHYLD